MEIVTKLVLKEGRERNLQTVKFTFPASSKPQHCEIEPKAKCRCEEF